MQEISVARFIWAFEFSPALDAAGNPVPPNIDAYSSGIAAPPLPFDCTIKPRSAQHLDVIKRTFAASAEFLTPFELELDAEDRKYNATHRDL